MIIRRKWLIFISIMSIVLILLALWRILLVDLPHPDQLYHQTSAPSTNIYDRHGTLLYQITNPHQGYHTPLNLADIPLHCRQATIATEDANFYQHPGFDTRAMVRALITNLREGGVVSGASTITQQLARNLLFSESERSEVSLTRKLREIILAWRLTQGYSKDEILTLYLNETYYGNLAYGLEAASAIYFGKQATELDLAECAMLAGLPQSPIYYNPLENLPFAKTRQADVLRLMQENGLIDSEQARLAKQEKLQFAAVPFPIKAPHFVMYMRGLLERQFGLEAIYTQGLQVQTTLDLDLHHAAQRAMRYHLAQLAEAKQNLPPRKVRNAAVIIMQPQTGDILAMVGSPNYFDPKIDGNVNAALAARQPGSSIKPLTYAAAFDPRFAAQYGYRPLTAATMMMDVRTAFVTKEGRPYVPLNYDRSWRGPVLLRESLANSLNVVAVKVLDYVGLDALLSIARQLGITSFDAATAQADDGERFGLALTLGGGEVSLLELTAAYAAFANAGYRTEAVAIQRVTNAQGDIVYQRATKRGQPVLDPRTTYLITHILGDNKARAAAFGEGSVLRLTRPAAAKTGTTTDFRDNWTMGYTPDFVTGVWVGNADNEPMRHVSGITGAAPIWHDIMETLHKGLLVRVFVEPQGLTTRTICAINGLLPSEGCQRTLEEIFITGTQPTQNDTWHKVLAIDRRTGLLAAKSCPPEVVINRWFTVYPVEAEQWVARNQTRQAPQKYSPLCLPAADDGIQGRTTSQHTQTGPALTAAPPLQFTSPDPGNVYRLTPSIPLNKQKIHIAVQVGPQVKPQSVQLWLNGQLLTEGREILWQMQVGEHRFEALGIEVEGQIVRTAVDITVR